MSLSSDHQHRTLDWVRQSALRRRGALLERVDKFIEPDGRGPSPAAEQARENRSENRAAAPGMPAQINERHVAGDSVEGLANILEHVFKDRQHHRLDEESPDRSPTP